MSEQGKRILDKGKQPMRQADRDAAQPSALWNGLSSEFIFGANSGYQTGGDAHSLSEGGRRIRQPLKPGSRLVANCEQTIEGRLRFFRGDTITVVDNSLGDVFFRGRNESAKTKAVGGVLFADVDFVPVSEAGKYQY
jgi:hypothetical protein